MITVRNLTNSPFDLQSTEGTIRLPAFGEVSGEFTGDYLQLLQHSHAVQIVEVGDSELAQLRSDYQEVVGKKAYHGWSAAELQEKINAKLAE